MTEERMPPGLDPTIPNVARMYDRYLGGKDNYAVDREAAAKVLAVAPQAPRLAQENRAFLTRAVRFLVGEAGVRQFLDIGAGLPTQGNVHEVARAIEPDARVAYVDNDPVVLAHGRALLGGADDVVTLNGDLRRPDDILADPELTEFIDFGRPVAVLLISVLHCLNEDDKPHDVVGRIRAALPPGSHLVISHITAADHAEGAERGAEVYRRASTEMTLRSREQILGFFEGFTLLEPGLVAMPEWRPEAVPADIAGLEGASAEPLPTWFYCGVGRL